MKNQFFTALLILVLYAPVETQATPILSAINFLDGLICTLGDGRRGMV